MTTLNWSEECKEAIKDVRKDTSEHTWIAITYDGESMENMTLLARGDGDAEQVKTHLVDDKVIFVLL